MSPKKMERIKEHYLLLSENNILSKIIDGSWSMYEAARWLIEQLSERGETKTFEAARHCVRDCIKLFNMGWRPLDLEKFALSNPPETTIEFNKKKSKTSWRRMVKHAISAQDLKRKSRYTQDFARISIQTETPVVIIPLGDLHIGAIGADYKLLEAITDEVLNTPELYVTLEGDEIEMAIKMRNVKEVVAGQVFDIEQQINIFEDWLKEIRHKVLWAGWGNHETDRMEALAGFSIISRIIGKDNNIVYHNGIGHIDLDINGNVYKIVCSHKFKGDSFLNNTHSQSRYMRFEGQDREIAIAGHTHKPGFHFYYDGEIPRLAINTASLNVRSGYAKRYYSLFTIPEYPVIEFAHNAKIFQPFINLAAWKYHNETYGSKI